MPCLKASKLANRFFSTLIGGGTEERGWWNPSALFSCSLESESVFLEAMLRARSSNQSVPCFHIKSCRLLCHRCFSVICPLSPLDFVFLFIGTPPPFCCLDWIPLILMVVLVVLAFLGCEKVDSLGFVIKGLLCFSPSRLRLPLWFGSLFCVCVCMCWHHMIFWGKIKVIKKKKSHYTLKCLIY